MENGKVQCNIDSKGKLIRLVSGVAYACVALALLVMAVVAFTDQVWMWVLGVVLLIAGVFQVFEAWTGWCVLRAMGFRTRI